MASAFKGACVQTTTGSNIDANIRHSLNLVRRARDAGADFIGLPEVVNVIDMDRKALAGKATLEGDDPMLANMRGLAEEISAWILIGSIVVKHESSVDESGRSKFANRSILIDSDGLVKARYDKIHMFDVNIDSGESYRESKAYEPGDNSTLVETPWGMIGLTVCYDLRFPHLFRDLSKSGAEMFSIPSLYVF